MGRRMVPDSNTGGESSGAACSGLGARYRASRARLQLLVRAFAEVHADVYIRFVGTHAEYDDVDGATI
jgi:hypothetical protein